MNQIFKRELKTMSKLQLQRLETENLEWLSNNGMTISKFARLIGTNYQSVSRWVKGQNIGEAWKTIIQQKFPDCPWCR